MYLVDIYRKNVIEIINSKFTRVETHLFLENSNLFTFNHVRGNLCVTAELTIESRLTLSIQNELHVTDKRIQLSADAELLNINQLPQNLDQNTLIIIIFNLFKDSVKI